MTVFASSARTVIPPTTVTAANLANLQSQIGGITKAGGGTNIASSVNLLTANFTAEGLGDSTYLNVATDGELKRNPLASAAANAASAGVDGLSFEAIGSGANTSTCAVLLWRRQL